MQELSKVKRVLGRHDAESPHEILIVLDATTGSNALEQAMQFREACGLTGAILTTGPPTPQRPRCLTNVRRRRF
jgi:fused signal recognition particle receptor